MSTHIEQYANITALTHRGDQDGVDVGVNVDFDGDGDVDLDTHVDDFLATFSSDRR